MHGIRQEADGAGGPDRPEDERPPRNPFDGERWQRQALGEDERLVSGEQHDEGAGACLCLAE